MRQLTALIAAALVAAALASNASADKPSRDPAPAPPEFTISGSCSFDVDVTITAQNAYALTFGSGSQIITGQFFVTLTNADTGKWLDLNVSGPLLAPSGSNQLVFTGRSLDFFAPGDLGPGSPGALLLISGPAVITFGENSVTFDVTSASVTDLCAALSG
jgi:hypothetical protein